VEGESPPTAAAEPRPAEPRPLPDKYGRWALYADDCPTVYIAGTYEDVAAHVKEQWPPRTRIIYAPEASPLPERPTAKHWTWDELTAKSAGGIGIPPVPPVPPTTLTSTAPLNSNISINGLNQHADAASFCYEAARLVSTDRRPAVADKLINFRTWSTLWNAYLECKRIAGEPSTITPHDVASMMELAKVGRRFTGTYNADNYVDAAGYAGCAGELAAQEALSCHATTPTTDAASVGPNVAAPSPPVTKT
jgi:hypothetical protein